MLANHTLGISGTLQLAKGYLILHLSIPRDIQKQQCFNVSLKPK